jgi:site-specific recombinase XerD
MKLHINETDMEQFRTHLEECNLSPHTVKKYVLDICKLKGYMEEQNCSLNRDSIAAYLESMKNAGYKLYTLNTIAASINSYCRFIGQPDLQCSHFKIRRKNNFDTQSHLTSEEYDSLIYTAQKQGDFLMALLVQVLASTEIRMNELQYLTVESLKTGVVRVIRAGEIYDIYIPDDLLNGLSAYVKYQKKESGIILSKKNGQILDRKSLWRNLKKLAEKAGVNSDKVCSRNLKKQLNKGYIAIDFSERNENGVSDRLRRGRRV